MSAPLSSSAAQSQPTGHANRKAAAEKWRDHFLVNLDGLDGFQPENITSELLAMADKDGVSVAHTLAMRGELIYVPGQFLTRETFAMSDKRGRTVGHSAAVHGHLNQVPSDVLKGKTFYAGGVGYEVGISGQLSYTLPSKVINNPDFWTTAGPDGRTVAHGAAAGGHLDHVPEDFKTAEFFAVADKNGHTVAHSAARRRHLYQVPVELHTRKFYEMASKDGKTVAHMAASSGALHQIPSHLQTMEIYSLRDHEMNSVAHEAALAGHLDQVPKSLRGARFYGMHNRDFETVETVAYRAGHRHQIPSETAELAVDRMRQSIYASRTGRLSRDGTSNKTLLAHARSALKRMKREGLTEHDLFIEQSRLWDREKGLAHEQADLRPGVISPPNIEASIEPAEKSPALSGPAG